MNNKISEKLTKKRESIEENKKLFASIDEGLYTKDGLFPCKYLEQKNNQFWFNDVRVSPNNSSKSVAKYLFERKELWRNSCVRIVDGGLGTSGRAPMYGVSFQKAVEEAFLKQGCIKSQFYLPEKKDDIYYSNLLLHINQRKESNGSIIQLQAWQYCIGLKEVFYIHAESKDFKSTVQHLDGAKIFYQHPEDIKDLVINGNKIKGDSYEKQFRIDGNIPMLDFYAIIKKYLPVQELVEEAFEEKSLVSNQKK